MRERPPEAVRRLAEAAAAPRDFWAAVTTARASRPRLIAEIKKASPSAGLIRADFDPAALAQSYASAGAAALSVLTDETYFQGRLEFIALAKEAARLPVLRKDFIVDAYQVDESRAAGADAVLLIAAVLDREQLEHCAAKALAWGMTTLIEVHDAAELDAVLGLIGADRRTLLGINNRDLRAQTVNLDTTERLAASIDPGVGFVAESGIKTREDVERMGSAGAAAVLIGETFMRSPDVAAKVRELFPVG